MRWSVGGVEGHQPQHENTWFTDDFGGERYLQFTISASDFERRTVDRDLATRTRLELAEAFDIHFPREHISATVTIYWSAALVSRKRVCTTYIRFGRCCLPSPPFSVGSHLFLLS